MRYYADMAEKAEGLPAPPGKEAASAPCRSTLVVG